MVAQMKVQRFLIDQLAARQVDENGILLHEPEPPLADYAECFASQGCRQENHVGHSICVALVTIRRALCKLLSFRGTDA